MFAERARAVSPTFDAHVHRVDVEEICRRLDGIPLAIELVAARTRTLTPPDLVERLDDRLRLLTGGRRTGDERHRTLRATIAWSYDLLARPHQELFGRLSVFAGPFGFEAAHRVAGDDELHSVDVDDLLGDLVERSMLIVESGPFGRRFRMLETMREFASELLGGGRDADRIAGRHAGWCLEEVTQIHHLLVGPDEVEGVARLAELWPNLRAGFDRACNTGDRELAGALVRPVAGEVNLRRQVEISEWAERVLALTPPGDTRRSPTGWRLPPTATCRSGTTTGTSVSSAATGAGRCPGPLHARVPRRRRRGSAGIVGRGGGMAPLARRGSRGRTRGGRGRVGAAEHRAFAELDAVVSALADRYRVHGPPTLLYVAVTLLGYSAFFQGRPDQAHGTPGQAVSTPVTGRR